MPKGSLGYSLPYMMSGYDYGPDSDDAYIIVKDNRIVAKVPTRQDARDWIAAQRKRSDE